MATFRVGQRVRIVASDNPRNSYLVGREAMILRRLGRRSGYGCVYELDIIDCDGEACLAANNQLAPLTDPHADAFIERIKRLGKEPINDAPKEVVR